MREEHIVHFFRDVVGLYPITKDVLSRRTTEYKHWVEAFARNHKIPMEWAQKGVRKEDYVRPHLERMQRRNRYGVCFILQSMEQGFSFQSINPKYANEDPNYRPIRRRPSRFTHLHFYIRDEVLGPMVMCVGTFLTEKGAKVVLMMTLFHSRVCGRWPTPCFITVPTKAASRPAKSRPPTTELTALFSASLICLQPREQCERWILRSFG